MNSTFVPQEPDILATSVLLLNAVGCRVQPCRVESDGRIQRHRQLRICGLHVGRGRGRFCTTTDDITVLIVSARGGNRVSE